MTIAEMVRKMLEAHATSDVVAIAIQAMEEERQEVEAPQRRRRARKPELVAQRAV